MIIMINYMHYDDDLHIMALLILYVDIMISTDLYFSCKVMPSSVVNNRLGLPGVVHVPGEVQGDFHR